MSADAVIDNSPSLVTSDEASSRGWFQRTPSDFVYRYNALQVAKGATANDGAYVSDEYSYIERDEEQFSLPVNFNSLPINMVITNLSGANLRNVNADSSDFSGADLSETCLRGAQLSGARFEGANLSGADMNSATLYEAKLAGVNLSSTNLYEAKMDFADLRGATVREQDLRYILEAESVNLAGALVCIEGGTILDVNASSELVDKISENIFDGDYDDKPYAEPFPAVQQMPEVVVAVRGEEDLDDEGWAGPE